MRLVGGPIPSQGVVQVFANGIWGHMATVSSAAATVICRQTGMGRKGYAHPKPIFFAAVNTTSVVWRDGDSCTGAERDLLSCATDTPATYMGW